MLCYAVIRSFRERWLQTWSDARKSWLAPSSCGLLYSRKTEIYPTKAEEASGESRAAATTTSLLGISIPTPFILLFSAETGLIVGKFR